MTMSMHDAGAADDPRLARLLARWADAHRLDARQAAAIRERVLTEAAPLDFDWWWRLLDPEHGQAFRGLDLAPTATGPVGWPPHDGEFRPYLRLT
jgi:hypothetical protein